MKIRLVIAALVVAATTGMGSLPASSEAVGGASLRLLDRDPLTVQGLGFKAREPVRVELASEEQTRTQRTTASLAGRFTTSFANAEIDRCDAFLVRAVGARGSRAVLKRFPPASCLPARSPS